MAFIHYFQFRASTDRTWEETVPEKGVFTAPSLPVSTAGNSSNRPSQLTDESRKTKKSRWN